MTRKTRLLDTDGLVSKTGANLGIDPRLVDGMLRRI